jgi:hypothetical protein
MRHQDQVAEIHKLLSHLETRTTAMADSVYRNPVSDYICPEQAAFERETFSRNVFPARANRCRPWMPFCRAAATT